MRAASSYEELPYEELPYEEWSAEQLRKECARRSLRTAGCADVMIERLMNHDEHAAAAMTQKRKLISPEEQAELNERLLRACKEGTPDNVRDALSPDDVNVNCSDDDDDDNQFSPLMRACCREDRPVAEAAVRALLERNALVNLCNRAGCTAIHYAARYSSDAVVALLLDAKGHADLGDRCGTTPLIECCGRRDDDAEALKIAQRLLDWDADEDDINVEKEDNIRRTPLLQAAACGSPDLVELLLSHDYVSVNKVNRGGETALMWACGNRVHGPAVIAVLVREGAKLNKKDHQGRTALHHALSGNASIMQALAPLYPAGAQLANAYPGSHGPDPIGCMREGARWGVAPIPLASAKDWCNPACFGWAALRLNNGSPGACIDEMAHCKNASLWRWAGLEMLTARHPVDGSTLLHVAARANNAEAVNALMAVWMNPLLLNNAGLRAADETKDPVIRKKLLTYATNPVQREVMRWYGPYLTRRVWAFLLVLFRYYQYGVPKMPKDLVRHIVSYVLRVEPA